MQLSDLGLSQDDLAERVVEAISASVLYAEVECDEDGRHSTESAFSEGLRERVRKHIDKRIEEIAEGDVLPKVDEMISNLVLQESTKWGEPEGDPMSFVEYLTRKGEEFLTEKVSWDGRKPDYNSKGIQTRLTHMVHSHLYSNIERAMKAAIGEANETLADSLVETCKIQLGVIAKRLTVDVKVPR